MTDTLFDAYRYGPGRPERKSPEPKLGRRVQNGGDWHIVVRRGKAPHPLAHRLKEKIFRYGRWEGGWVTRCGLVGATVELPEGPVQACEKCCKVRAV